MSKRTIPSLHLEEVLVNEAHHAEDENLEVFIEIIKTIFNRQSLQIKEREKH
uniref:Uncharacterized protein n=1 Tax=Meloidogyne enterolobii TaxID=390850 RepID=A0A6V7XZH9_MELEN|nr:unnamed protein product [Meloidogyne enterolobii]